MPKVRGRPDKGEDAKRHSVSLRVTPAVMERLDAAIAENGRSLAQELEVRVAQSFDLEDELGGPQAIAMFRAAITRIRRAEARTGKSWLDDFATWTAAREIIGDATRDLMPPPPNFSAMVEKTAAYTAELEKLNELYRELLDRWPRGDAPPVVNALAVGIMQPLARGFAYGPDGELRSPEELQEIGEFIDRIKDQEKGVIQAESAMKEAEAAEAEAKRAGMDLAREITALIDHSRKV